MSRALLCDMRLEAKKVCETFLAREGAEAEVQRMDHPVPFIMMLQLETTAIYI